MFSLAENDTNLNRFHNIAIIHNVCDMLDIKERCMLLTLFKNKYDYLYKPYTKEDVVDRKKVRYLVDATNIDEVTELYPNLVRIDMKNDVKEIENVHVWPEYLQHITFGRLTQYNIYKMPKCNVVITVRIAGMLNMHCPFGRVRQFYYFMQLPIKNMFLEEGIEEFNHVERFNQECIQKGYYPQSLKRLSVDNNFNSVFATGAIPDSVEVLKLGYYYQQCDIQKFPESLTTLEISNQYGIKWQLPPIPKKCEQLTFVHDTEYNIFKSSFGQTFYDFLTVPLNYLYMLKLKYRYPKLRISTSHHKHIMRLWYLVGLLYAKSMFCT